MTFFTFKKNPKKIIGKNQSLDWGRSHYTILDSLFLNEKSADFEFFLFFWPHFPTALGLVANFLVNF